MAEPARKLDESARESIRPKLGVIQGGGEGGEAPLGNNLQAVEQHEEPEQSTDSDSNVVDLAARREQKALGLDPENDPHDDAISSEQAELADAEDEEGWKTNVGKTGKESGLRGWAANHKRGAIGGGVVGILISSSLLFSIFLAPALKLESFLSRINQRTFGYATTAVENAIEKRVGKYMFYRLNRMQECGGTVNINCRSSWANTTNPATRLFRTWQDARVEEKLFDRFGIQLESRIQVDPGQNTYSIMDRHGRQIRFGADGLVRGGNTSESRVLGRELRQFFRNETKWYEVMQRRSIRKYMTRKHGINSWCWLACNSRDQASRKITDAKTRLRYKFLEKAVYPMSSKYGLLFDCLTGGGNCDMNDLRSRALARGGISADEADVIIRDLTDSIGSSDGRLSGANGKRLTLTGYFVEKMVTKLAGRQVGQRAANAIPVAGQILFALQMAVLIDTVDQFIDNNGLTKAAAAVNSAQYLEWYATMRTSNDEFKSHAMSAEDAGALMSMFEGAEQSNIYQARYGSSAGINTVSAAEVYTCANGEPLAADKSVCDEKKIAGRDRFAIEKAFDNPFVELFRSKANVLGRCLTPWTGPCVRDLVVPAIKGLDWVSDNTIGRAVSVGLNAVMKIPNVGGAVESLFNFAVEQFSELTNLFMGKFFPLPVPGPTDHGASRSEIMKNGRENYDGLEAGGEMAAYEYCQGGIVGGDSYGLGCRKLNTQEASAIMQQYTDRTREDFESSSLYTRLASLDYSNSLASTVLAAVPTSFSSWLYAGIPNMLNSFAIGIQNIFSGSLRATPALGIESPFGIPLYGYTDEDLNYDPETLDCVALTQAWEDSAIEDPETGFTEYTVSNPCLLEEQISDVAGALFR